MDYLKINQQLWNNKTAAHFHSDFYDVPSFLAGKSSLNAIELALLGTSIKGKRILHLQCHFGLDSFSLARLSAQVTAVDFSEKAIQKARELKHQLKLDVQFIQSDINQLDQVLDQKFDLIFTSYGVLGWHPDLLRWAEIIHHFLMPGGRLILVEFHPVVWMFDDHFNKIAYEYMNGEAIIEHIEGTYADKNAALKDQSITWNHGLSTVIQALLKHQLNLQDFKEYNYSPYNCFEKTVQIAPDKYQIVGLENKIPMVYSLIAQKKG